MASGPCSRDFRYAFTSFLCCEFVAGRRKRIRRETTVTLVRAARPRRRGQRARVRLKRRRERVVFWVYLTVTVVAVIVDCRCRSLLASPSCTLFHIVNYLAKDLGAVLADVGQHFVFIHKVVAHYFTAAQSQQGEESGQDCRHYCGLFHHVLGAVLYRLSHRSFLSQLHVAGCVSRFLLARLL